MLAYIFPGQGSQQKGMGGNLFSEFHELTEKADAVLGYSIKELCLENYNGRLSQTQFTQPALYVVNALSYLKKIKESGKKPDFVAGHSLGEFSALFASAVFDFETGLKLVKKRGELMSQVTGGGMAAIIGFGGERVSEILEKNNLKGIDIANYNTPTQVVISGLKQDIEHAKFIFEAEGAKRYVLLNVSGAFHSRYMVDAKEEFKQFLSYFEFSRLTIPVISNLYARPYEQNEIKKTLEEQITSSVRWTDSIRYLMGEGEIDIQQVGNGKILNDMVLNIKKYSKPLKIEEDEQALNQSLAQGLSDGSGYVQTSSNQYVKDLDKKSTENFFDIITEESLGDKEFKRDYKLKYAYLTGSMYRGISSKEMVIKLGRSGMMGFLGTGGLKTNEIENSIKHIQSELKNGEPYGVNLLCNLNKPQKEEEIVDIFMKYGINVIEASAFITLTPAIVRYRLNGLKKNSDDSVMITNKLIAKVSRPEVARKFLGPPNEKIVEKLLIENKITTEEAELSRIVPMADDICVEADSGGHTDQGIAYTLMPAMIKLRDEMMKKYKYSKKIRVGAAGGISTPEAAAAAFMLGADFILTGSINQCTVEAGTSNAVKDLLEKANVQDTEYAPAGDMFEIGAKIQVLKRGLFFPARANKLYELYRLHNSLEDIDEKTRKQLQEKYFKKSFGEIYSELKVRYPHEIERAEKNPKHKMAMIFRWYFNYSMKLALEGIKENEVDYQVHCGPSMGAFNQWVKGGKMESWRNRFVDEIGIMLMQEAAKLLNYRFRLMKS